VGTGTRGRALLAVGMGEKKEKGGGPLLLVGACVWV